MSVPFIDLRRFESGFQETWVEKVAELSKNTAFVGGPEAAKLEEGIQSDCGVAHAIGCANGTDALQLALRGVGVGPGDTVLLPDATFWATFEAVVNVGAKPVTVDISRDDLQMDLDLFKEAAERLKPKAAMLVHLYGWGSSRLDEFRSYCKANDILLVEDGAQAYGVSYKGKSIYADALVSTISFYPAKVLGACGDAGAVVCNDEELAGRIRALANHGRTSHYSYGLVGWNSRMGGFEAAYLNLSREHLNARLDSRRKAAAIYREKLAPLGITTMGPPDGYVENGYLSVTLHEPARQEELKVVLKEKGIGFGVVYPGAMSAQEGAAAWIQEQVGGDNARWLSTAIINLPLFPYITEAEIDEVVDVLKSA
jgi:dTDP-4-amino-4,6-dideoxygalactose transaminase